MYVTVIQGKGKIGFLECFEIKDKLKQLSLETSMGEKIQEPAIYIAMKAVMQKRQVPV